MRVLGVLVVAVLAGCSSQQLADPVAAQPAAGPVQPDPAEVTTTLPGPAVTPAASPVALPEVSCPPAPPPAAPGDWRHSIKSRLAVLAGDPNHRGVDLVTGAGAAAQTIAGKLRYGLIDKALEDETVELFACRAGAWQRLGEAVSDDEGSFSFTLRGAGRLPIGRRPLYLSVVGDRSGAAFTALIAPDGAELVVSDMDGTLTTGENDFPIALVTGGDVGARDGAPAALAALAAKGYQIVYMSSRGRIFLERSREWLAAKGFPPGALRLASAAVTLPGSATTDYKADTLAALRAAGLTPAVGFGNRATDAAAYRAAAIAGTRIFLHDSEFADENADAIARGDAIGFDSYRALMPTLAAIPAAR